MLGNYYFTETLFLSIVSENENGQEWRKREVNSFMKPNLFKKRFNPCLLCFTFKHFCVRAVVREEERERE